MKVHCIYKLLLWDNPSLLCEYMLLLLVNKEVTLAYSKAEYR